MVAASAFATPGPHLPFLYPRWVHTEGLEAYVPANKILKPNQSKPDSTEDNENHTRLVFRRVESANQRRKGNGLFTSTSSDTPEVAASEAPNISKDLRDFIRRMELTDRIESGLDNIEVPTLKAEDKGLQVMALESGQLSPDQIALIRRKAEIYRSSINDGVFKNSLLKTKGRWTYDWRIALMDLKDHTPPVCEDHLGHSAFPNYLDEPLDNATSPDAPHDAHLEAGQGTDGWTRQTFLASIGHLAKYEASLRSFKRQHPQSDIQANGNIQDHLARWPWKIRDALFALLQDETARHALSHDAFHMALRFLEDHSMLNDARHLINLMDSFNVTPTAETFNILLWGTGRRKDLHNYTRLLKVMIGRDLRPTVETWISFVATIESNAVKFRIAKVMTRLGLIQSDAVTQRLVVQLIDAELHDHVREQRNFSELVNRLDTDHGRGWLSMHSGLKICTRICENGSTLQIVELFRLMQERRCPVNGKFLNPIMSLCKRADDPRLAIRFLELFQHEYGLEPDDGALEQLFMLGFSKKWYNTCRLLWSVVCVEDLALYPTKKRVYKSLVRNTPRVIETEEQRWLKHAGKVIMGQDLRADDRESDGKLQSRYESLKIVSTWAPNSDQARLASVKLAKQLYEDDLSARKRLRYDLKKNFVRDLRLATERDELWDSAQWKEKNQDDLEWKIRSAIKVEFQPILDDRHRKFTIRLLETLQKRIVPKQPIKGLRIRGRKDLIRGI